ncbi:hypothetical protein K458DRAFT_382984 [Lentithecium fluviatile CBS 122367]|uniref:Uncharacterized protein n=1 Tax=Lentithecium fluviatile CBS 122367 TaxID=1168545 RepID=A0A6G1JHB2_9PLEO|nr:hypothetical protein K458DRAFT_382984 [Lentithecium fluviatile CBS 122367]
MWWETCETVYCGFWIDWENGAIKGSMLTLPNEWALVLGAFIALFVKLGGEHLWRIICFVFHQINASPKMQDDIHHQHQLVLRNPGSETDVLWNLSKIAFAHKGARFKAYRRSFFLVILAIAHGIAFYAAAGLSSAYVSGSKLVQVNSRTCGDLVEPDLTTLTDGASLEAADAMLVLSRHGYRRSANYAKACYAQSGINATACGMYVRPKLSYTVTRNTRCPFDEKICNGTGILLDSGYIRSDSDMGINTRPEDAISVRKTLACVPLAGERYTDGWLPIPDDVATLISFPPGGEFKGYKFGIAANDTFLQEYPFIATSFGLFFGQQPYDLSWLTSFLHTPNKYTHLSPIPELQSNDSDVYIIGLTNRVNYRKPINDTWFSARNCTEMSWNMNGDTNSTLFTACTAESPLSFLGCQERYQYCTADGANCSPLTGLDGISSAPWPANSLDLSPTQTAIYGLYQTVMRISRMFYQLGLIGRENLVAGEYLWDDGFDTLFSAPLPDDHWEAEMRRWMDTALALMQRAGSVWARPPEFDVGPGVSSLKYIVPPQDAETLLLCRKIKVRSDLHASFSVLGLGLTLGLGCFIILLNSFLPALVSVMQKRIGKGLYNRLEWVEMSGFQLQRMAAEGRGIGPWEDKDGDIPRLVERGHVFNLTGESLSQRVSSGQEYELVPKTGGATLLNEMEL